MSLGQWDSFVPPLVGSRGDAASAITQVALNTSLGRTSMMPSSLDLSNCSLTQVEDLQNASKALIIDLSLNPMVNISDAVFQGFIQLNQLILPPVISCPGGNASWEKVEAKEGNRVCEGQRDLCNQTGQLSIECPENSLCGPNGPGFFECSCADKYHGYKCLREGEFPSLQVFVPLGASTVVLSLVLWVTQRRKVKPL
ncbi:all-trans retinoic acid-induced differentiation factor isoform X2 [Notolabrus celidotus]|uniref:all-trans retinoic acid-induced differentiation factor isoform X2 n=1 Tax=Notolabrus celidotus TaxID=1203425 RepID=UPI0014901AFD|nr:all-trans retinoic acid-induced differentiation factor isoform X2 [Notolabrus celidotus]